MSAPAHSDVRVKLCYLKDLVLKHGFDCGAQEKTRTSTPLRAQVPETCASTNSATWAPSRRCGVTPQTD